MNDGTVVDSNESTSATKKTTASSKREERRPVKRRLQKGPKMSKEQRREKYTAKARERRNAEFAKTRNKKLTCFRCRRVGHAAADCNDTNGEKICYRCGSDDHALQSCPKLTDAEKRMNHTTKMNVPFATCFICRQSGHLASQCERNERGIYVKGGCCRQCHGTDHLFIHCPMKKGKKNTTTTSEEEAKYIDDCTVDEFLEPEENSSVTNERMDSKLHLSKKKRKRVVKF